MIKVVFMGTPVFSVPTLEALLAAPDVEVQAVVCSPDRQIGRHQELSVPPVKVAAQAHGIPVHQPETLKGNEEFAELLRAYAPDMFVVVAYGFIIPKEILNIPRLMAINIHGSLLPKYRGASPIQSALLHGERTTGLTFIEMVSKMDAGPMISQVPIIVAGDETSDSLFDKLSLLAAEHICDVLRTVVQGALTMTPQDPEAVTFCGKMTREMGLVHLRDEKAEEIYQKWQAFTSWPGIYVLWEGKRLKLLRCSLGGENNLAPGEVRLVDTALHFGTQEGSLAVHTLQLEGKKAMDAVDFAKGYGQILNSTL